MLWLISINHRFLALEVKLLLFNAIIQIFFESVRSQSCHMKPTNSSAFIFFFFFFTAAAKVPLRTAMKFYPSSLERSVRSFCPFAVKHGCEAERAENDNGCNSQQPACQQQTGCHVRQAAGCSAAAGLTGAASVSVLRTSTRKKPENAHPTPFCPLCLKAPRGSGKIPSFLHAARPNQSVTSRLHRLSRVWNIFFFSASKTADNCDRLQGVSAS